MILTLGRELSRTLDPGWAWVWWVWLVTWFVLGLAVALVGLVGKFLRGTPSARVPSLVPRPAAPVTSKQGE